MLSLFLHFELGKWGKYLRTKTLAKTITVILFACVFLFIGAGIYGFFVSGFRYIRFEAMEDVQLALNLFLYEVFLLVLAGIGMFSAIVSGVFSLFRGNTNTWILSSSGYTFFPKIVFVRSFLTASLPLFVMFIPAVLALIRVYHLDVFSLVALLLSVIFFVVIISALSLLSILLVGRLYYRASQRIQKLSFNFRDFILILMTIVITATVSVWKIVADVDLVHLFRAEDVTQALSVTNIGSHFLFLPTHPFAMEILNWQTGNQFGAIGNLMTLFVVAVALTLLWWKVSASFYPLWQAFQEGNSSQSLQHNTTSSVQKGYRFSGGKTMVLFTKELLVSTRNWKGISWFLFLALIWLTQIGANVIMGHNIQKYQPDVSEKTILLQVIQFIIAIYFISSFTLRFVFPSFSVEKKTSWILGTAPLNVKKLFFGKYFFYTTFLVLLGLFMNSVNTAVLGLEFIPALYAMTLFVVTVVCIVTFGLSLGALFPSTETDDPEVISTSMPGLFFTAVSLIYGALADLVLYNALKQETGFGILVFITVSIMCSILLVMYVPRLLKERSF